MLVPRLSPPQATLLYTTKDVPPSEDDDWDGARNQSPATCVHGSVDSDLRVILLRGPRCPADAIQEADGTAEELGALYVIEVRL